jgi:hypothetical protein
MIWRRRLEEVDADAINELVSLGHREDANIDYKEKFYDLANSNSRVELFKDVAAFANEEGGDLVFGVAEEGGAAKKIVGGIEFPDVDKFERQVRDLLAGGLNPRLTPGIKLKHIDVGDKGHVLVLRTPRSASAPHMVKEKSSFPLRRGSKVDYMDTREVREAFLLSERWAERFANFRAARLAPLVGKPFRHKPAHGANMLVVHVSAFGDGRGFSKIDLQAIKGSNDTFNAVKEERQRDRRFNADGFCVIGHYSYTQFFRDGSLEVVVANAALTRAERGGNLLALELVEDYVRQIVNKYMPLVVSAGASYPFSLVCTLLGVRAVEAFFMGRRSGIQPAELRPFDVEEVSLPDVLFESDEDLQASDVRLKPVFDALCQCVGVERSLSYDAAGNWKRADV